MIDSFDPRELYSAFQVDASEQLGAFAVRVAALRDGACNDEDWTELYRAVHTVKGGGALLGLKPVADLAQAMCLAIRRQRAQSAPEPHFWEMLAEAGAALHRVVDAAIGGEAVSEDMIRPHVERLAARG